uniref:Large ribosomal subunit protein mL40 n=1 Tax=Strongyloides venezuelensis TaxID=75913 RepID=A0A0K0F632_STRVS
MFRITSFLPNVRLECSFHTTPLASTSIFMKRQKRMDPELARQKEIKRRRKLEKEIRELKKQSKKLKPIDEMSTINEEHLKDYKERQRNLMPLSEKDLKEETILQKKYSNLQSKLWKQDDMWIRNAVSAQEKALERLKILSPQLYASATKIDDDVIKYSFQGPPQTQIQIGYEAPDGDFFDVTKKWT